MSKEEVEASSSLLERLKIEPEMTEDGNGNGKEIVGTKNENPFMRRKRSKSLSSVNLNIFGNTNHCFCSSKQKQSADFLKLKNTTNFKKKTILREPVLKTIKCSNSDCLLLKNSSSNKLITKQFGDGADTDFRSIIDACKQLSLANANDGVQDYSLPSFKGQRSIKSPILNASSSNSSSKVSNSCSHQARLSAQAPPPCDVTIDELASYFETFVHIPKKMSSMAEMMYI